MLLEASAEPESEVGPEVRSHQVWRAVFSFPVVMAILLVVLTVFTIRSRFSDPDLWWHLKTGEIIWNTHSIPRVDVFSFTANNHPYTPHEWLSQLTIYNAWRFGGYSGLMLWLCVLSSVFVIGAYALCALYSGSPKVAFLGGLIAWLFGTVGLAIRPQLLGYILLLCELLILYLGRSRDSRWFLALPPLFAIWVNVHGSFFLGLVLLAIVLFCAFLDFRIGLLVSSRWEKRKRRMLAIGLGLSVAALFANPIGLNQVAYPINTMFGQHLGLTNVAEWQPPAPDSIRGMAMLAVAGLVLLIPSLRRREIALEEFLFLALGFGLGIRHERMEFVFGILAAPIICRLLADAWEGYELDRDRILPNAIMITLLVPLLLLSFPGSKDLERQVEKGNPVKAVEFINRSGLSGRMVNEYVFGGYLIWASPEHKVFIDGRSDVFEWTGVLKEYTKWELLQANPSTLLDKYRIAFCLLSRNSPMSRVLPVMRGWRAVYSDDLSEVFVRTQN